MQNAARFAAVDRELADKLNDGIKAETEQTTQTNQKDAPLPECEDVQKLPDGAVLEQIKSTKNGATMKHFSLHFAKSAVILNIDAPHSAKEVSFHIPDASSIINVKLDDAVSVDETNPSQIIESVEEHLWQEVTIDSSKLLQHYLKLSKIRLTGKFTIKVNVQKFPILYNTPYLIVVFFFLFILFFFTNLLE